MTSSLKTAALLGALAVAIGAFGAHGLKSMVGPEELVTFNTGVRYHFYHVFALGLAAVLFGNPNVREPWLRRAVGAWVIGIILFSGSLYLLTLQEYVGIPSAILGPITPIGGLFFIVGWVCLFLTPKRMA